MFWHIEISDWMRFGISIGTILMAIAYVHSPLLQKFRFALVWLARGFGIITEFVNWIFAPIRVSSVFSWASSNHLRK